jgi:hypothetical protein
LLSQYAGQGPFNRLGAAYGIGQSQAGQNDVGLQRALQLLGQGAFGQPTVVSPSGLQQGAQLGGSVGQIMAMLPYMQQGNYAANPGILQQHMAMQNTQGQNSYYNQPYSGTQYFGG